MGQCSVNNPETHTTENVKHREGKKANKTIHTTTAKTIQLSNKVQTKSNGGDSRFSLV